jgi:hypothetical protein
MIGLVGGAGGLPAPGRLPPLWFVSIISFVCRESTREQGTQ